MRTARPQSAFSRDYDHINVLRRMQQKRLINLDPLYVIGFVAAIWLITWGIARAI